MKSAADILYSLLAQESSMAGWELSIGFLGDEADNAICFFDTDPIPDGRIQRTGETIEHPCAQVFVRSLDYADGFNKIQEIADIFDGVRKNSVATGSGGNYILQNVSRSSGIHVLGIELENNRRRHQFTLNVTTTINETT